MILFGIALSGFGTALYITCGLGAGPRDGWMIGLVNRTRFRLWKIRFSIELFAIAIGFALGGRIGVGTVLIMLFVGQTIAISLTILNNYSMLQEQPK